MVISEPQTKPSVSSFKKRFTLFAPYVKWVKLVASWLPEALEMQSENHEWMVEIQVPDGRHTYYFKLPSLSPFNQGREVSIADPFARLIEEAELDQAVIVIQNGHEVTTDYVWQHDDVPLPADDDLVIYECHVGEFAFQNDQIGTFKGVTERIGYLKELGISALELMPIMSFPMDKSWGYNVRHPFAPEQTYGTPQDLKTLIDQCHAQGIRVILDLVLNHQESDSPLSQIDYYYWFRDSRPDEQSFGPKFDYEHTDENTIIDGKPVRPAMRYALEVARYWVQEYHIDGYRLDATAVIDNFELVQSIRDIGKSNSGGKPFYVTAEQLPENPAIATPIGPADGAWHRQFREAVVAALLTRGENLEPLASSIQPRNHGYSSPSRMVNYVESHDETTFLERLAKDGMTGNAAFCSAKLAAVLLLTAVGNPMLYQGQEFGGCRPLDLEVRALQWELLDAEFGLHLKTHYAFLIRARHESPALKGEELEILLANDGWLAYRRGFGEAQVIVVVNLREDERNLELPLAEGHWHEMLFDYSLDAPANESIPGLSAKIYTQA
jgi:1,4-alpha-glucan branching enzyme